MRTARAEDKDIITDFFPDEGQTFGTLNKPTLFSRWSIDDTDFDDLVNWISFGKFLQQTPALSPVIATLPAPAVWISAQPLNGTTLIFALCTNNNLYQVSLGGTVTQINGATSISILADIANWQGTTILFSDSNANKVYSWNGSTFATVFSSQPCSFITVYGGRLWMTSGTGGVAVTFTAAGTFNSLGGDSGTINITEYDCPPPVLGMIPTQGLLYLIGYNWVQVIGNLFDTGVPAVLQVTRQTAVDQAGMISKWSLIQYSYSIYYANLNGLWAFYAGSSAWVSEEVGGFFQGLILANSSFSAAFGFVNQLPCLFWNICWNNAGTNEYTVLGLDTTSIGSGGKPRWFRLVYGNIAFITSGVNQVAKGSQVWAVDTAGNITQLFGGTAAVTSIANTKLWNFGTRIRWKEIERAGVLMVFPGNATITAVAVDQGLNTYNPQLQSANPNPTNIQWIYSGGSTATWSGTTTNIVGVTWQYSTLAAATWKYSGGGAATFGKMGHSTVPVTWELGGASAVFSPLEFYFPLQCQQFGLNLTVVAAGAILQTFGVEYKTTPADWGL